ncbi:unnamed protein product [Caenorhabditis auriculariae]|uniref:Uncharacterized protein n=1 Tax=Caenorhabditis auriculariae TaxID=2777116 RepID=A0A8S1GUH2_9PELO|nr:unnamed protein product [Caenorhabditis auriculariae]
MTNQIGQPLQYSGFPSPPENLYPSSHYGFMLPPQQNNMPTEMLSSAPVAPQTVQPNNSPVAMPQPEQPAVQTSYAPVPTIPPAPMTVDDQDHILLSRSLAANAADPYRKGTGSYMNGHDAMVPCASYDGRSVTIDHLKISPESLIQIAKLAQAFGASPDWREMKLAEMQKVLSRTDSQNPSVAHQYSRSVGL